MANDEATIRIPEVCEATGVNYGSVYHHFGSREGVIDAAYHFLVAEMAEDEINFIRKLNVVGGGALFQELMSATAGFYENDEARTRRRNIRLRAIAASVMRPTLRAQLSQVQTGITDALEELVEDAQLKGIVRNDVTARSVTVLMLSTVFGRAIDDCSTQPINPGEWAGLVEALLSGFVLHSADVETSAQLVE